MPARQPESRARAQALLAGHLVHHGGRPDDVDRQHPGHRRRVEGHFWLIVFGLAVSIPFVVFSSNLLSRLMDRFPALIYIGAGILGKVGGDMILTDPFVVQTWHPTDLVRYCVEGVLVVAVIVVGRLLCRRRSCSNLPTVPTNIRNPR